MITEYTREIKTLTKSDLCEVLGIAKSTYYRRSSTKKKSSNMKKPSPRKLSQEEENKILSIVNSERFCDMAPGEYSTAFWMKGSIIALSVQSIGY